MEHPSLEAVYLRNEDTAAMAEALRGQPDLLTLHLAILRLFNPSNIHEFRVKAMSRLERWPSVWLARRCGASSPDVTNTTTPPPVRGT